MTKISYFPFNSVKERGGRGATHEKRKRSTEDRGRKADIGEDMRKKKQRWKTKTQVLKVRERE